MKAPGLTKLAFALILSSLLVSCEKDNLPAEKPDVPEQKPAPTAPSSPVDAIPPSSDPFSGPSTPTVPQTPTVPSGPAIPGLLRKVSWAPLDYNR